MVSNKLYIYLGLILTLCSVSFAANSTQFNIPSCWVLNTSGSSIDPNCDGTIDLAANTLTLNGFNSSYFVALSIFTSTTNTLGDRIDSLNSTKLDASDQRYNDTAFCSALTNNLNVSINALISSNTSTNNRITSVNSSLTSTIVRVDSINSSVISLVSSNISTNSRIDVLNTSSGAFMFLTGSNSNITLLKFNTSSATGSFPLGQLGWDVNENSLSVGYPYGATLQVGKETYKEVTNLDSVTITEGTPVSVVSASGNREGVKVTNISNAMSAYAYIDLATTSIAPNQKGLITIVGDVHDLNTNSFTEGAPVYIASNGSLTQTYPTAPNYIVNVGVVTVKSATAGIIAVTKGINPKLTDLSDIDGTPINITGQILVWNESGKVWDAFANINDYLTIANAKVVYYNKTEVNSLLSNLTSLTNYYNKTEIDTQQQVQNNSLNSTINSLVLVNSSTNARIDSLNSTKLDASDQRYNDTALIGQYNNLSITGIVTSIGNYSAAANGIAANISGLNTTKLDITDQRYNDTALINAVNNSLNSTINSLVLVNSSTNARLDSLNLSKLDATDQRYNDSAKINQVNNSFYAQGVAVRDPTGFKDTLTSTLSFNNNTMNFTLIGTYPVYINSSVYTRTNDSLIVDSTPGLHFIYYNDGAGLKQSMNPWEFESIVQVATVYYDGSRAIVGDERHGIAMSWRTHEYLHETVGARYSSGLAATFNDTAFTVGTGEYYDEDIEYEVSSVLNTCDVVYHKNSTTLTWLSSQTQYYFKNATNMYYDALTGLAPVTTNNYMAVWIFASNNVDNRIVCLLGQRQDNTIGNARANNLYDTLNLATIPVPELKLLYRVIIRNDATPYEEAQDYRSVQTLASGNYIATDHGTLTGLLDDDHTQYLLRTDATVYNDTALINAVNTSSNIQSLGFNTTAQLDNKYGQLGANNAWTGYNYFNPTTNNTFNGLTLFYGDAYYLGNVVFTNTSTMNVSSGVQIKNLANQTIGTWGDKNGNANFFTTGWINSTGLIYENGTSLNTKYNDTALINQLNNLSITNVVTSIGNYSSDSAGLKTNISSINNTVNQLNNLSITNVVTSIGNYSAAANGIAANISQVNTTAMNALPKSGGTMTGDLTVDTDANATQLTVTKDGTGTGNGITITNKGTGYGMSIAQTGNNIAQYMTSSQTAQPIIASNSGADEAYMALGGSRNSLYTYYFQRNIDAATSAAPVMGVVQDNASDDQTSLVVQQDGTGNGIVVDGAGTGYSALFNNGNVGIGTLTPRSLLDIRPAGNNTINTLVISKPDGTNDYVQIGSLNGDGAIRLIDNSGNVKVLLHSDSSSYFTGGNVGIGTLTPSQSLSVVGTANISSTLVVGGIATHNANISMGTNCIVFSTGGSICP